MEFNSKNISSKTIGCLTINITTVGKIVARKIKELFNLFDSDNNQLLDADNNVLIVR